MARGTFDGERALATPRLLLEPLVAAHAPDVYNALRDPGLYHFIPREPPESREAVERRYRGLEARRSPDGREDWLNWIARRRDTGEIIGTVEATVRADRTALLAYMIFAPFQRQGYAREACARVLDHLFADRGVSLVAAEIDTRNAASIALVERLGFARVAFHRDADHFKGATSHEYRYELRSPVKGNQ